MSAEDLDFSRPGHLVKDIIYAKNAAEGRRHVIARETFLQLYAGQPEFKALMEDFLNGWRRKLAAELFSSSDPEPKQWDDQWWDDQRYRFVEELVSRVGDFVCEHGPPFPWLLSTLLFAAEAAISLESRALPVAAELFRFGPKLGESLQEQTTRWKEHNRQVLKKLRAAHGKFEKRSEGAVQRDVRWYFENECMGRSIPDIARELEQQNIDDNKEVYFEYETVRDGIKRAEDLLSLELPEVWLELES